MPMVRLISRRTPRRAAARCAPLVAFLASALALGTKPGEAQTPPATPQGPRPNPQQQLARDIYQDLLEINTTQSVGDTYQAAQAMGARLIAAGFPEADVHVLQSAPKRGNLVARLHGTGNRKPILLGRTDREMVPGEGESA